MNTNKVGSISPAQLAFLPLFLKKINRVFINKQILEKSKPELWSDFFNIYYEVRGFIKGTFTPQ